MVDAEKVGMREALELLEALKPPCCLGIPHLCETPAGGLSNKGTDLCCRVRKTLGLPPPVVSEVVDDLGLVASKPMLPGRIEPDREPAGQYRKRPVVIEAFQYLPNHMRGVSNALADFMPWVEDSFDNDVLENNTDNAVGHPQDSQWLKIKTLEGDMRANPGDWIIRGVKGEIYACKPDIFEATYEPLAPPSVSHIKPSMLTGSAVPIDGHFASDPTSLGEVTRERLGREMYRALYGHQGGDWRANETQYVWFEAADRLLSTLQGEGGKP